MPSYANLSKCCKAPMLASGTGEGTHWYICSGCGCVCDPKVFPLKGKKSLDRLAKSAPKGKPAGKTRAVYPATKGWPYAAPFEQPRPKSCFRANMGFLFALMTFLLVCVLIATATR